MDTSIFVEQTFQLYKANDSPRQLSSDVLAEKYAIFLYNYLKQSLPLSLVDGMIQMTKDDFVRQLKVKKRGYDIGDLEITYISVRAPRIPRQNVIFVRQKGSSKKDFKTVVLVRSLNGVLTEALLKLIEVAQQVTPEAQSSIYTEDSEPLKCTPLDVSTEYVQKVFSELCGSPEIGSVDLSFGTSGLVKSEAPLRQIAVSVPSRDVQSLGGNSSGIYEYLLKKTSINFSNLPLGRFTLRLVNLSREGKIRFHAEADGRVVRTMLFSLLQM